jgi:hypothetical protein
MHLIYILATNRFYFFLLKYSLLFLQINTDQRRHADGQTDILLLVYQLFFFFIFTIGLFFHRTNLGDCGEVSSGDLSLVARRMGSGHSKRRSHCGELPSVVELETGVEKIVQRGDDATHVELLWRCGFQQGGQLNDLRFEDGHNPGGLVRRGGLGEGDNAGTDRSHLSNSRHCFL